jgi:hypothetical protein
MIALKNSIQPIRGPSVRREGLGCGHRAPCALRLNIRCRPVLLHLHLAWEPKLGYQIAPHAKGAMVAHEEEIVELAGLGGAVVEEKEDEELAAIKTVLGALTPLKPEAPTTSLITYSAGSE